MKIIEKTTWWLLMGILLTNCSPKTTTPIMNHPASGVEDMNAFRKSAPVSSPAPEINVGDAATFILDNGLQVIVVENHKIPSVSLQFTLKNDPINEYDKVGYVSMSGDLMGRGTTSKTKAEIDEAIDFIGAQLSTYGTGMYASSLTKHLPALLDIMKDVLYHPSMPAEELEKIKKQTLTGLEAGKTDPDAISRNMRASALYGTGHPYGEVQKVEHVNNVTIQDCRAYIETFFAPNNAYLVVVGDITPQEAEKITKEYFGDWKKKVIPDIHLDTVAIPTERHVLFANKKGAVQSVVNIAYPVNLKPGSEDWIAARVMNTVLGGGSSGRLNLNIREDKGFTYGAYSRLNNDPIIGSFNAQASVRNSVTDSTITQFLKEMSSIIHEPVGEEELQTTKNYLTGTFSLSLESPRQVANFALNIIRYNLPKDYYQTYLKKLNAVTPSDIQAVAQKYIRPDAAYVFVVGSKDDVAEKLIPFDADGELTYYNAFGETLKPVESVLPDGVSAESVIADYVNALGGENTLADAKNVHIHMTTAMMGQTLNIDTYIENERKFAMNIGMSGMVIQEQKYDGEKVLSVVQGQKQILTQGPVFDEIKAGAQLVVQRNYISQGYKMKLIGIEEVEGVKSYKLIVESPEGKKSTEFYAIDNGLLIRMVTSPQEGLTVTTNLQDYREVSGIMFPFVTIISGMMPMDIEMKVSEIEVNGAVPEGIFAIE